MCEAYTQRQQQEEHCHHDRVAQGTAPSPDATIDAFLDGETRISPEDIEELHGLQQEARLTRKAFLHSAHVCILTVAALFAPGISQGGSKSYDAFTAERVSSVKDQSVSGYNTAVQELMSDVPTAQVERILAIVNGERVFDVQGSEVAVIPSQSSVDMFREGVARDARDGESPVADHVHTHPIASIKAALGMPGEILEHTDNGESLMAAPPSSVDVTMLFAEALQLPENARYSSTVVDPQGIWRMRLDMSHPYMQELRAMYDAVRKEVPDDVQAQVSEIMGKEGCDVVGPHTNVIEYHVEAQRVARELYADICKVSNRLQKEIEEKVSPLQVTVLMARDQSTQELAIQDYIQGLRDIGVNVTFEDKKKGVQYFSHGGTVATFPVSE